MIVATMDGYFRRSHPKNSGTPIAKEVADVVAAAAAAALFCCALLLPLRRCRRWQCCWLPLAERRCSRRQRSCLPAVLAS